MQNGGFVNKIQVVWLSVAKIHRHVFENPGYQARMSYFDEAATCPGIGLVERPKSETAVSVKDEAT